MQDCAQRPQLCCSPEEEQSTKYFAALLMRLACANPRITWLQARTSYLAMADVACRGSGGAANEAAGPHASRPPRSLRRACSQSYCV
jgi:hypothetical protein